MKADDVNHYTSSDASYSYDVVIIIYIKKQKQRKRALPCVSFRGPRFSRWANYNEGGVTVLAGNKTDGTVLR